jgi:hypothetical protein
MPNSFSVQTRRFAELEFLEEHQSVFIGPARLIGIVLFCADVSIIGCSDYSLRNFPLAIRRRGSHIQF